MPPAHADQAGRTKRGRRPERARGEEPSQDVEARRVLLAPIACVVGLALVTYLPLLRNGFIDWDDPTQIIHNPRFNPPTLAGLAEYWRAPRLGEEFYVPLNYTASWLLAAAGRTISPTGAAILRPWPYHAAGWLIHAACAALVLVILRRLTGHRWAALVGAALFALHPVQVEPLAWASSLYSILSGFFALLGIWQYLVFSDARYGPVTPPGSPPRFAAWSHYAMATLAFAAAMLTKPTVVVVPLMIAAIEIILRGRHVRDFVAPLGVWLLLAAPIVVLVREAERGAPMDVPSLPWRVLIALDSLAFYLYRLVVPIRLAPDYGRSPHWVLESARPYYAWVAPVILLAVSWHVRRDAKWVLACTLLFVAALLPTLGLVPFDYQRYSTVADRYLYLAMLAPALALAWVLSRHPRPVYFVASSAAVAVLAVLSHVQTYRWRDSQALFTHTLSVNPRSLAAHVVFGYLHAARGDDEAALAEFEQALRANSTDAAALSHVGNIHLRRGRFEDAAAAYRAALVSGGAHPAININLGAALAQLGRTEEAASVLNDAVLRLPDNADAHANLANVLTVRRNWAGARRHYETALRLDPQSKVAREGLARLDSMGR